MNIQGRVQDFTHPYPKLLTHSDFALLLYFWLIWITTFYNQTVYLHSLQVGMFLIIVSISATGFSYLEVDLGIIIGSYWTHILFA